MGKGKKQQPQYDLVDFGFVKQALFDGHEAFLADWKDKAFIFMVQDARCDPVIMIRGKIDGKKLSAPVKWKMRQSDALSLNWVISYRDPPNMDKYPGLAAFSEETTMFLRDAPDHILTDISENVERIGDLLKEMRQKEIEHAEKLLQDEQQTQDTDPKLPIGTDCGTLSE